MLTGIKFKNWQIKDFEDIAICYQHDVPIKLLSKIYKRTPNSILKLMERTGLRAIKKASRGASYLTSRKMFDTLETIHNLINSIRCQYKTQQQLHNYLIIKKSQPRTKIANRIKKRLVVIRMDGKRDSKNIGNWTSLNHVIEQARQYGYDIIFKDLKQLANTQSVRKIILCNGCPTTIHQLLLLVNRHRMQDNLPLLWLEGITDI